MVPVKHYIRQKWCIVLWLLDICLIILYFKELLVFGLIKKLALLFAPVQNQIGLAYMHRTTIMTARI